jgi:hypothetical protein
MLRNRALVAARVPAVVAVAVRLAAQQDMVVPFRSRFGASSVSIWREAVIGLAAGLVWYGCWKLLAHLITREGARRTKTLRYLAPTVMLAGSWIVFLALSGSRWPTEGLGALLLNGTLLLFILVDAPALFVSSGLLNLAVVAGLPPLYQGLIGSAAAWLVWFGIIRFCEWRREVNARVSLRITD